nr:unnamed protein product [Digitaria exilis]
MSTLSPLLSLLFASITYHRLLADVFPHLCSVILAGSTSCSVSPRLFLTASITAAEVVHPRLEVDLGLGLGLGLGLVGCGLAAAEEELPEEEVADGEAGELAGGEDAGGEALEVVGEGPHGGLGERLAEADAEAAVGVLAVHGGGVRVVGGGDVGADQAPELHLRPPPERRFFPSIIDLSVPTYQLGAHDSEVTTSAMVEVEVDGDEPGAAAHAGEVVGDDVLAEAEAVDEAGHEGRLRGEGADVEDDEVDVACGDAGLGEDVGDGAGEEVVHLVEGVGVGGGLLAALEDVAWAVGVLADAGVDDDLEEELVLGDAEPLVALDHRAGHLGGHLAVVGRAVARHRDLRRRHTACHATYAKVCASSSAVTTARTSIFNPQLVCYVAALMI